MQTLFVAHRFRKVLALGGLLLIIVLCGCRSGTPVPPAADPSLAADIAEPHPSKTVLSQPTDTPVPSHTPTSTPLPTDTPIPSPTATDPPQAPTSTPTEVPVEEFGESIPLSLKTVDGVHLSGELTLPDEALDNHFTLLLAHEHGSNRQSWRPLMADFIQMGFTVLSFDFRGHGESGGSADFSSLGIDVSTFTQYLLDSGYDRIICLGSSMGGTGCLEVALSVDMEGLVLVSAPMNIQGSGVTFAELEELRMPKLVMVAENDSATYNTPDFVTDILKMYELAPEPKELFVSPSSIAHGLALLYGKPGEEARTLMFDFLEAMIGE